MGHGVDGRVSATTRLDATAAKAVATTLQALATPSRLMILIRLREGSATVGELAEARLIAANPWPPLAQLGRTAGSGA